MEKLVRRLFPKRPVLGVTLLVVITIEAGTLAASPINIGKGTASEGAWNMLTVGGVCLYTHDLDPHTITNKVTDPTIWKYPNEHHSSCTTAIPNFGCPGTPVNGCSGEINQDHFQDYK